MAPDGSITVTLNGVLAADFIGDELTNTAVVASTTPDPDSDDNTATVTTPTTVRADLTVTKTASVATATAGQDLDWTVRVTNGGPSTARSVVITDQLPAGVRLISADLDGAGECETTGGIVCQVGSLAVGASAVLAVTVRVGADVARPSLVNSATATAATADPDPLDNSDTSTVPVQTSADLALTKTGPPSVSAGAPISWQLSVTNTGPSDAVGVVVTDRLPVGILGATATFDGGTCTLADGLFSCPVGRLPAGSRVAVTVSGTVDPALSAASLTNQAAVSSSTPDPDTDDQTASSSTEVTSVADLSLTKTGGTGDFVAGQLVSWTIVADNAGPSVARQVVVRDTLPVPVTEATSSTPGCTIDGRVLTCAVDELAPGSTLPITVTGTLAADYAEDTLANTASVSSATDDPDVGDNTATSRTDVAASADLAVNKVLTSGPPIAGAPIAFSVIVDNDGPSVATDVVVTDELPDVVSAVVATPDTGSCTVTAGTVRCALGTLAVGEQVVIEVRGTLSQDPGDRVTNSATVTSGTPDPDSSDNSASASAAAGASADLGVTKTGPDSVDAGDRISWTITVTNNGPSPARDVTLADPVADGIGDVEVSAPAGVNCTEEVECAIGTLAPGKSVVITLRGRVDPGYPDAAVTNKATVASTTPDPDSTSDSATTSTSVTRTTDLAIAKSSSPETLTPGEDATYTLMVTNDGPSTAASVQVTDALPDGLSLRGSGPTSDTGSCAVVGRVVSCDVDSLAPGASLEITIPVSVDATTTATGLVNSATVGSATVDGDPDDNTTTLTSPTAPRADLTLNKSGPAEVVAGTPLSWQLELSNAGPSDAQSVVVSDRLPAGIGSVTARTDQGSCEQEGRTVTCRIGTLAAGDRVGIDLTTVGVLDPSFDPGEITNTAVVSSPTSEPVGDDEDLGRDATADTEVLASADISVVKVPISSTAVAGDDVSWRVTVINNGPSTAEDVVWSDPAPEGVDDVVVTPPAGVECDADNRCEIGTLEPGADNALVFLVTAAVPEDSDADTVTNTATAGSSTDDPDPGDNRATAPVLIAQASGVSVVKTPGAATVTPGQEVSWTVRVRNAGPSLARDVQVSDAVPAGMTGIEVTAPEGVDCETGAAVRCDIGNLRVGAGAEVELTLTGTLNPDYEASSLSNTAVVTTATADPDGSDNSSTAISQVVAGADLSVTKTGPATVTAGDRISWEVTVSNDGPSTARDVVVSDTVPTGVGSVVTTATDGDAEDCQVDGSTVTCRITRLASGADAAFTISGVVDPATTAATLTNTATVSSATADPDPDDNRSDPVLTQVQAAAALSIVKSVDPEPIAAGQSATFTLQVRNAGPSVARDTVVTDQVPTGMTVGTVRSDVGDCATVDQLVTCDLGDVAANGSDPIEISIEVEVSPDLDPDAYSNTASVLSVTPDPDFDDNTSTVSGDTVAVADLKVTKTADREQATPGGPITWSVVVRNDGPATARDVLITDRVPATVQITSITLDGEPGCSAVDVVPVTCSVPTIRPGDEVTVEIKGTIDSSVTDTALDNTASAASATTTDDDPSDNTDRVSTPLRARADISVSKRANGPFVAGGEVGWTVTVRNDGPAVARAVVLSDPLPVGVTADAPEGCAVEGRTIRCELDQLAPDQERAYAITAILAPGATGTLTNTARADAGTADPESDNNAATVTTGITSVADLAVTKTADATSVTVGDLVHYTIAVTNAGPSTATAVWVRETWPDGLQLVDAEPSQGSYGADSRIWTVGPVADGGSAELVLTGRVRFAGDLTNTVQVSGAARDPEADNDIAAATVAAAEEPPFASPPPINPGPSSGPPDSNLPSTGGPSLLVLLVGLVAVLAGARLLRHRRRR
ncbi:MAG: DUF11 domain-containing protein [Microlunatus sp.]|nr:DUF11 domain-containing protein [Microlunatus sp.]